MRAGSGSNLMKIELGVGKLIHQLENIFLLVIALLTVIGACKEIYVIADKRDVGLQDLLLMFLYVEVLAMVGAYYESKQIPITLPIFIAITALARLSILQKGQEPLNLIYEAGAILILAIASVVVNYRPVRAARTIDRETSKASAGLRPGSDR
jgi:protein PsiE